MSFDKLAERFLDKVMPETRMMISDGDLKRAGITDDQLGQAVGIIQEYTDKYGVRPTIDQVVAEARRREAAVRRRGL